MTATPSPDAPPGLSRRAKVAFSLILVCLTVGLMQLTSYIYLRLVEGYDGHHLYQYTYDPYKNILPAPNYRDTRGIQHNAQGFRRSTGVTRDKPAGTYRVFLMGASAAYGLGGLWTHIEPNYKVLTNQQTIDAYLERILTDSLPGRTIEVINAAITSTWTHHNLIYLNQTILNYHPDMVLFLDGYNDYFFFDRGHEQFDSYSYNLPARVIMGEPTPWSLAYAGGWWLFREWALFNTLGRIGRLAKQAVTPHPPQPPIDPAEAMSGLRALFPRNALAMERRSALILRAESIPAVFMLQPMLILERDRPGMTPVEKKLLDFNVASYRPGYEAFMQQAVPYVRERMTAMTAETGARFIDLTGIYKAESRQIYTDYAHLTPLGNELLARYVAARILPDIRRTIAHP